MSMVYDFKWKPSMKAHIERHGHITDQELSPIFNTKENAVNEENILPSSANLQLSQNWAELVLLSLDPATHPTRASLSNASRGLKFGLHIKIGLARQKKGPNNFWGKIWDRKIGSKKNKK